MSDLGSMLVFAARYAHTRNTGASLMVVNCAIRNRESLLPRHRDQLIEESHEAVYNLEDWAKLREEL